jgi:hypothetical protein
MNYSISKIILYQECPFKFKRQYIDKVTQAKSKYLSFGLALEDTIEHVFKHSEDYACTFNDDILKELMNEFWICTQYKKEFALLDEAPYSFLGYSSKKEEQKYKDDGFQYLKEYFSINKIEPQVAFELKVSVALHGRTFNGRVDHIKKQDDKLILIDNKVSDKIIYNMDTSLQLGFYLYAMRVLQPRLKITHLGYYYAKLNKLSIIPVEKVKLKDILSTIKDVCDKIEEEKFDKQVNGYCYFCQFKNEC